VPATSTAYQTSSATVSTVTTLNVAATTVNVVQQTVTVAAPAVPSTFFLQAPGLSGYYGRVTSTGGFDFDQTPSTTSDTLYLDDTCNLRLRQSTTSAGAPDGFFVTNIYGSAAQRVLVVSPTVVSSFNLITCAIVVNRNLLQCTDAQGRTRNVVYISNGGLYLYTAGSDIPSGSVRNPHHVEEEYSVIY
ncbi:hypothetical protein LTR95_015679, partial [Oleoguttula sp. CCFEE 5521]